MVKQFTDELVDLFVEQKFGLSESLEIMAHQPVGSASKSGKIRKCADYLLKTLEKGNLFSLGIKTCPYIDFDETYVSFIVLSETTGNLSQALVFLQNKYNRRKQITNRFIEACLYPAFVMLISVFMVLFLSNYIGMNHYSDLLQIVIPMVFIFILIFILLFFLTGDNRLYEAFLAIDFLLQSGVKISNAVEYAVKIVGIESRSGRVLESAGEKLEFGMTLQQSLKLGEKFEEGFYFAEKAGGKNDVFGKLALWMKEKDERKRKICLSLIEPLFISLAGIFLLLIVLKFFMPYITNFDFL